MLVTVLFCSGVPHRSVRSRSHPVQQGASQLIGRIDFESCKDGEIYDAGNVRRDFGTSRSWGTYWPFQRARIADVGGARGRVLKVSYPKGRVRSVASGASWYWRAFTPRQEMFLGYWVYFPGSFAFRHGGKMHGLTGGKGNTGGKKPNGHDGWSCRVHWGPEDKIKLYLYHMNQPADYGESFYFGHEPGMHRLGSPYKRDFDRELHIKRGEWHFVCIRVYVNDIGKSNGQCQAWFDSGLVLDIRGIEFRDATCATDELLVNAMYFSTFFGGRDERYKPVKNEIVMFDDFMLSGTLLCPEGWKCDPVPVE